jgi:hypothetical protein
MRHPSTSDPGRAIRPLRTRRHLASWVAAGQGVYYLATGVWPLVSMRTFEAVTGRKRDRWLVRVVGLLAIAMGSLIVRESADPRPDPAPGLAGAAAFGTASLWYWARGQINHAYALDGLVEAATFGTWLALLADQRGLGSGFRGSNRGRLPAVL